MRKARFFARLCFPSIAALVLGLSACSEDEVPEPGTERGPCYGNGTCNADLVCLSDVCVKPGGADAGASADGATATDAAAGDASGSDAAPADATPLSDAGAEDAVGFDTGTHGDASTSPPDGSMNDAGSSGASDAGLPDSAVSDGGTTGTDGGSGLDANGLCTSNRDCNPGHVCGDLRIENNVIVPHCILGIQGQAAVGAQCSSDPNCRDNICLSGIINECSVVCSDANLDCPSGFACVAYRYQPGPTWVNVCNRSCARNADCGAGDPNSVCTTTTHPSGGGWALSQVCNSPAGSKDLGETCGNAGECRTGICMTSSRFVGCTGAGGCDPYESCVCPQGGAPPCAGGGAAACVSQTCTALCVGSGDCTSSYGGNPNTSCSGSLTMTLPDNSQVQISACERP